MAMFDDISKELEEERKVFETEMRKIKNDRDQLAQRTSEFNTRLLAHEENRFEINNRIQNALKKFQIEKARTKNIEKEISNLKENYSLLQVLKSEKDRSLRYFTQFYTFLNSAVQCSEEFGDINDLISRADALKSLHLVTVSNLSKAIMNTYHRLDGHIHKPSSVSVENALDFIMNYIIDLEQVNKLLLQEQQ
ncbi:conserved hypothetical protein [Echinococcus multilocularis]|uniref:DUF4200 domain-containing protein n=1 Tax=Echinococcus multilocularis TaxID=6211 RepID=A0A087W222_ECHMU|nr:conserved hypothetical protein [Echinococcus multilocularis]